MLTIYDDLESLSLAAARLFAEEAKRALEERGRFDLLLSGGETPSRTYQLLAADPFRSSVPWGSVHFFWGDERYVPHDDPRSNFGTARRTLLNHLDLREEQIHPIPYAASPQESAQKYETELRRHFGSGPPRFDLVFLGLGADGHTASLFPGTPLLRETTRLTSEVYVREQDLHRVTVTPVLLNQAALVIFLVTGSEKAEILRRVLEGEQDPWQIPAQSVKPREGRLVWLVDRQAARLLSGGVL